MARTRDRWTSRDLARRIARLCDEKQAERITVLDVAEALQVTDYFVICEGQNRRHIHGIAESVAAALKREGLHRMGGTPMKDESWVLIDFGPVVLHVFSPTARAFYDLDNLWGDCPKVRFRMPARKKPAAEKPVAKEAEEPVVEESVDEEPPPDAGTGPA